MVEAPVAVSHGQAACQLGAVGISVKLLKSDCPDILAKTMEALWLLVDDHESGADGTWRLGEWLGIPYSGIDVPRGKQFKLRYMDSWDDELWWLVSFQILFR